MTWPFVVAIFVGIDLLVGFVIVSAIMSYGWGPLVRKYPAREPLEDAVRRNNQSFKLGMLNLGWCVHVAVDEGHLHLTPAKLLRVFGARPTSVPWTSISTVRRLRSGRWIDARIDQTPLRGPAWCLELAGELTQHHSERCG